MVVRSSIVRFLRFSRDFSICMVFAGVNETCGAEDPRIAYNAQSGLYELFYTAWDCKSPELALATSATPTTPGSWQRHGDLFAAFEKESKSGACDILHRCSVCD
jgi:predicted GH43/DUF377 family glycosyl hydrolase